MAGSGGGGLRWEEFKGVLGARFKYSTVYWSIQNTPLCVVEIQCLRLHSSKQSL